MTPFDPLPPHDESEPVLSDDRIIIRPVNVDDASHLYKWWNDPKIMVHVGFPDGLGISMENVRKLCRPPDKSEVGVIESRRFIILEKNEMKPIGEMSFRLTDGNIANPGLKIGDISYQQKGYGTKALSLLLDYLINHRKVASVELDVLEENVRAWRLYEKMGFVLQSFRPEPYLESGTSRPLCVRHYVLIPPWLDRPS